MMVLSTSIVVASNQQVSSELSGETVILQFDRGEYYGLDAVGALVWRLIQGPQSVIDLRNAILQEYDVSAEKCEHDLLALLDDMATQQLIEVRHGVTS